MRDRVRERGRVGEEQRASWRGVKKESEREGGRERKRKREGERGRGNLGKNVVKESCRVHETRSVFIIAKILSCTPTHNFI